MAKTPTKRAAEAASSPKNEPERAATVAGAPEPVKHRLAAPSAPPAQTDEDQVAIRHIRRHLEDAGYSKHPQAAQAALDELLAVPVLRAGRRVQEFKAEAADFLRGKIQQRAERDGA